MTRIAIIDYGMSNLLSVRNALAHLGAEPVVVERAGELGDAAGIVLPGDGAFGPTMDNLRARGWLGPLRDALTRGVPFLGICLGMQLLFDTSSENGAHRGLGLIRGRVERFPEGVGKVPQIGWNQLQIRAGSRMFSGVSDAAYAYFVHSYYCAAESSEVVAAETEYGLSYASAVEAGRLWGTQFHPEKSGEDGLKLLRNFIELAGDVSHSGRPPSRASSIGAERNERTGEPVSARFTVYPALDLRGGRVVRLAQGRVENEVAYSDDPAATARAWEEQGARFLHVVDLDRALGEERGEANARALRAILDATKIPVQLGGGLRGLETIRRAFELGVTRAVLGTAAVERPELVSEAVEEFGAERVVVALDAREGRVVKRGWTEEGGVSAVELGRAMKARGVLRALVTDVARDGMMGGVDAAAMRAFARETGLAVIASGGVASLADVCVLARAEGVEGVIVGQALYRGAFTLREALEAVRSSE